MIPTIQSAQVCINQVSSIDDSVNSRTRVQLMQEDAMRLQNRASKRFFWSGLFFSRR